MKNIITIMALAISLASSAQPLFQVPKPTCSSVQVDVLTPDIFTSYLWDLGNGQTAATYQPPVVTYATAGQKSISLTVTSATPFRIIDTVVLTQVHPTSWVGSSIFCNDGSPDLFLEFLSYTTLSPYWVRTPVHTNTYPPETFILSGVLTKTAFPLTVWDQDDGFWCGASDFLGEITVPAQTTGGLFEDDVNNLMLVIRTRLVTSTTYTQSFPVADAPAQPTITCQNDTLLSSYPTANQWLNANLTPIPGANQAGFHPGVAGTYYVQYSGQTCPVLSAPFAYGPGCTVVATAEPDSTFQSPLTVWPNPAVDKAYVQLPRGEAGAVRCRLMDTRGALSSEVEYSSSGQGTLTLELGDFPAGLYILEVSTEKRTYFKKLTILRTP